MLLSEYNNIKYMFRNNKNVTHVNSINNDARMKPFDTPYTPGFAFDFSSM